MDTNDTTPDLGDFKASDDDSDDLVYEIQWDTSYDFDSGNLKTKTSDIDSGFVNTEDGGDTSPFTHNQKIRFTVQAGDAMTNGNTYWWRVKACDPSDACSSYSAKRSITIDDSLTVDQWLQTTTEQFGTDTLTDTEAAAGSVKLGGW